MTIDWGPVKDRIIKGDSALGTAWILLGKDGLPVSAYIICGDWKEKFFPEDSVELELDIMQYRAEIELEKMENRLKPVLK